MGGAASTHDKVRATEVVGRCLERCGELHRKLDALRAAAEGFSKIRTEPDHVARCTRHDDKSTGEYFGNSGAKLLEQWASSLPTTKVIVDAMPRGDKLSLRDIVRLSTEEIHALCQKINKGIFAMMEHEIEQLKKAFKILDSKCNGGQDSNSKFDSECVNCGNVGDFHLGLDGRIGFPNLQFLNAMTTEHCDKVASEMNFTASNTEILTNPKREWMIVHRNGAVIPPLTEKEREGRRIHSDVESLLKTDVARRAKLSTAEISAIVLYTGPMFFVYNAALRRHPQEAYADMVKKKKLFSTTIHVLVSAVQKITRVEKLPNNLILYRGLGGNKQLPQSFFEGDENGFRGMVEWGFMSTSTEKSVAVQYSKLSGIATRDVVPIIFEICTGAVDRGASIEFFSQYPQEQEYLILPCSFLEPAGVPSLEIADDCSGIYHKINVRLNANLKTLTVEELESQKKKMHVSAFTFLVEELERELNIMAASELAVERAKKKSFERNFLKHSLSDLVHSIVQECKAKLKDHQALDAKEYLKDDVFRSVVVEYLDVIRRAKAKFEWWQASAESIEYVQSCSMSFAQRALTMILQKELSEANGELRVDKAVELCKLKGLITHTVEEIIGEETCFLRAVAEGRSIADLKLLIEAKANTMALGKNGRSAVMLAAQFGHSYIMMILTTLRELGADVNQVRWDGGTAIMDAARGGHCQTIRALFMLGADLNAQKKDGTRALMFAAYNGHSKTITTLVDLKADVNVLKKNGSNAVFSAAENGQVDAIRVLAELRADINIQMSNGWTPIAAAAENGHYETIETLIKLGHNSGHIRPIVRASSFHSIQEEMLPGNQALMAAVKNGHKDTFRTLLKAYHRTGDRCETFDLLALAARQGDCETVKTLISDGQKDINARGNDGETAIMAASASGHYTTVNTLWLLKADVSLTKHDGWTTIMSAATATSASCAIIKFLHKASADISASTEIGFTAVMAAAQCGHNSSIQTLADLCTQVADQKTQHLLLNERQQDGTIAVIMAALKDHCDTIRLLHEMNANIHAPKSDGATAMMAAAQNGLLNTISTLNELRADVNSRTQDGSTAIIFAASNGHSSAIHLLCYLRADIKAVKAGGVSAVFAAARNGYAQCLEALHNLGASLTESKEDGLTPLIVAAEHGHCNVVRKLHALKADPNASIQDVISRLPQKFVRQQSQKPLTMIKVIEVAVALKRMESKGWTALMSAAKHGHCDTITTLISLNADVNAHKEDGWTALGVAAYTGQLEAIQILCERKADVRAAKKDGSTVIMLAAQRGQWKAIKTLKDLKADLRATTKEGFTAVMTAAEYGHSDALRTLHDCGADLNVRNKAGRTALELAAAAGEMNAIETLIELEADYRSAHTDGKTPISLAFINGRLSVVKTLHKHGVELRDLFGTCQGAGSQGFNPRWKQRYSIRQMWQYAAVKASPLQ